MRLRGVLVAGALMLSACGSEEAPDAESVQTVPVSPELDSVADGTKINAPVPPLEDDSASLMDAGTPAPGAAGAGGATADRPSSSGGH